MITETNNIKLEARHWYYGEEITDGSLKFNPDSIEIDVAKWADKYTIKVRACYAPPEGWDYVHVPSDMNFQQIEEIVVDYRNIVKAYCNTIQVADQLAKESVRSLQNDCTND